MQQVGITRGIKLPRRHRS